jgi:phage-related protein
MSATIQLKFGTLALDSTNNITVKPLSEKSAKPIQTTNIPVTDGAIAEIAKIGPKTINIEGDIAGSSYDDLRTNLDALHAGLLGQGLAKLTKDNERYIYCQLKDFSYAYDHPTRRATWSASFIAHFPFWLSAEENQLLNPGFELWSAGASSDPDNWVSGGAGATIAREGTIVKTGAYSAKLTADAATANLTQAISTPTASMIIGCWVYATAANKVRIRLQATTTDGISSWHTGDSTWQWLSITLDGPAIIGAYLEVAAGATGYFDGVVIINGTNTTASNVIDERAPTSGAGYTVTNAGNAPARAKIEITAVGEIADACKIENTTTGESFQFRGTILATKKLEVDNRYDTDDFEVLNNGVDEHSNFEGDFITLDPGANTIKFTGTAGTKVKITFRNCWY